MSDETIQNTLEVLRRGGIILYPTDTVWGIGCDATDAAAVERIYSIKRRDHSKSMLILADALTFRTGWDFIDRLLLDTVRPTTVIMPTSCLPADITLADNLPADDGTIGVRLPQHIFCQALLQRLGRPIVSTSANFSGQPTPIAYGDICEGLKQRVDYCVPNLPEYTGCSQPSRIIKVSATGESTILRD